MNDTPHDGAVIEVTLHQFKNHISDYLHQLRSGEVRGIIIKRYRKRVAFLTDCAPGRPSCPAPPVWPPLF